jgi:hypothetical protein
MSKQFVIDTLERVVVTFVEAFLAIWFVTQDGSWENLTNVENFQGGLVGGVLALAKAFLARHSGDPQSASLAPNVPPP